MFKFFLNSEKNDIISDLHIETNYYLNSLFFFNYIVYCLFLSVIIITIITLILNNLFYDKKKFKILKNNFKKINSIIYFFFFLILLFKLLYISINYTEYFNIMFNNKNINISINLFLNILLTFKVNNSILSDSILILALSSGITCLYVLDSKNISKKINNITIFNIFIIATTIMVYSTNLLVIFLGFEMLFIPTVYFVYSTGYMLKTDKTINFLLVWTFFGAFLIFIILSYIYFKYKTLDYYYLYSINFSELENIFISSFIFLGFGIKIPIFPFYFWLTKVHVESPAGFSIYLSGFLVKAAIYCLYLMNQIFHSYYTQLIFLILTFIGICDVSIKLWSQLDFKRLIALVTVQEMGLIVYIFFNTNLYVNPVFIITILLHGWLSTLMFFMVDVIQKKFKTRSLIQLRGISSIIPEIRFPLLITNFLFTGFPGTVKYLMEFYIVTSLSSLPLILNIFLIFIIVIVGGAGFSYHIFSMIYGEENLNLKKKIHIHDIDFEHVESLSKRDKIIIYSTSIFLIILNFIVYVVM